MLIIAALLECAVFNFRTLTTLFSKPNDISEKINLQQTNDGRYVISSVQNTIELKGINQKVDNIHLKMSEDQNAQVFTLKINFTDSAHSTFFDTTEYSVGIPEVDISTTSQRSQYFTVHPTGQVKDMQLQITGEHLKYPLYIDSIVINDHYPFNFVF